jgi:hypothetical protein
MANPKAAVTSSNTCTASFQMVLQATAVQGVLHSDERVQQLFKCMQPRPESCCARSHINVLHTLSSYNHLTHLALYVHSHSMPCDITSTVTLNSMLRRPQR